MVLKPRLANPIALVLAGAGIACLLIPVALYFGVPYGGIPAAFAIFGIWWVYKGVRLLLKRKKLFIAIDATGIECPLYNWYTKDYDRCFIARPDIASIGKHESVSGRLIQITRTDGTALVLQARLYCELNDFLNLCRNNGLPVPAA